MKNLISILSILLILLSLSSCNNKEKEENSKQSISQNELKKKLREEIKAEMKADAEKKATKEKLKQEIKKELREELKKELENKKLKTSIVNETKIEVKEEDIKNLSTLFNKGNKLIKEQRKYQAYDRTFFDKSLKFKAPPILKKDTSFKYIVTSYTSALPSVKVYASKEINRSNMLFSINVSYMDIEDPMFPKSHKMGKYDADIFGNGATIYLSNDIHLTITSYHKSTSNKKSVRKAFEEIDIKSIESIFNKKSKYAKLKKHSLKAKLIRKNIKSTEDKLKTYNNEAVKTFKPFISLKNIENKNIKVSIKFTHFSNIFIKLENKNRYIGSITIGKHKNTSFFKQQYKDIKDIKFEGFNAKTMIDNSITNISSTGVKTKTGSHIRLLIKLPTITVSARLNNNIDFGNMKTLKEIVKSLSLKDLAKIK